MATILIVEDEPIVALHLQETIKGMGHSVSAIIDSGDAVLAAVMKNRPDLILMDIKLRSFIDGVDAAQRVKLMYKDISVIFLTAYPSQSIQGRALNTKPAAYLVKPVDDMLLCKQIEEALAAGETKVGAS